MELNMFFVYIASLMIASIVLIGTINANPTYYVKPIEDENNYAEVLELSLLFYEAQRSGKLPRDNRIPWRGDSALNDRGPNGEDLTGGYYDGSDLAGETAAALAASSIVFRNQDLEYSAKCLKHAKELYKFANRYRGLYHEAIRGAAQYYESTDYGDELAWAAAWLFKATNETIYLEDAKHHYQHFNLKNRPNEFFYNKKDAGVQVLLAQLTREPKYQKAARAFCDFSVHQQKRTSKGLLYIDKFGTLCHAANVAFVCLEAADSPDIGNFQEYRDFAEQQIYYMLGGGGRSYVVGWGRNPPKQPHHAASSCPDRPAVCGWSEFDKDAPNPQILYGALVSGPDEADKFHDHREDYVYTEVTLDYNAGFTSALAGLLQLRVKSIA
ncbi:endoglucanase E-4 isoform X2 [Osmia lignaria lignaria]|uniref:endoglucanase E-4 isoform X2 n=1 Tax=Osmia lignaria lignaria TaxID=1437193 RepID=UPI00402B8F6D